MIQSKLNTAGIRCLNDGPHSLFTPLRNIVSHIDERSRFI
jgi:hypothetical protein